MRSLLNTVARLTDTRAAADLACTHLLDRVDSSRPLTLDSCIQAVSALRGREIAVYEVDLAVTEIFGALMRMPDKEVIVFDRSASRAHRCHIVEHELGHLMLGHHGHGTDRTTVGASDQTPGQVGTILCRSDFHSPDELEAERFARSLRAAIHSSRRAARATNLRSAPARRVARTLHRRHR